MRRTVLLLVLATAATLLVGGAAWAATVAFAPAKNHPTGGGPQDISAGDLDGDRDTDLVTADTAADTVSVLVRRSDGTFRAPRAYAAGDYPVDAMAREDLDGDGDRDLAAANSGSDDVSVRLGRGDGTFGAQRRYATGPNGPMAMEAGDMDGDGDVDLVTANRGGGFVDGRPDYSIEGTVSVFKNRGDGTFAAARNYVVSGGFEPSNLDRSDFDGDGDLDLVVALDPTRAGDGGLAVMFNAGDGSFGEPRKYELWMPGAVVADDLDGDGDQDFATTDYQTIVVYKNRGDGTFGEYGESYPISRDDGTSYDTHFLTEADFDRDGDVDLAASLPEDDKVSVLLNSGDGTFGDYDTVRPTYRVGDYPYGITRARMNADSKPDLVVANYSSDNVSVLRNVTP